MFTNTFFLPFEMSQMKKNHFDHRLFLRLLVQVLSSKSLKTTKHFHKKHIQFQAMLITASIYDKKKRESKTLKDPQDSDQNRGLNLSLF